MMYSEKNGNLLPSELLEVEPGMRLAKPTAYAYLRMKAAFIKATGLPCKIASPIGAYRDRFVQGDMAVHPALYGLNPDSSVRVAAKGSSTHGLGNTVDIGSFPPAYDLLKWGVEGRTRREWFLAHASEFGFYREFNEDDPNHFHHDGFTASEPIIDAAETGGLTPINTTTEDIMTPAQEHKLDTVLAALGANNFLETFTTPDAQSNASVLAHARAAVTGIANVNTALAAVGKQIDGVDESVWATDVARVGPDGKIYHLSVLQDLANTGTNVAAVKVDPKALAAQVVAQLPADQQQGVAEALANPAVAKLIEAAAQQGAQQALGGLTLRAQ